MRRVGPFYVGLLEWPAMVTVLALVLAFAFGRLACPSPELLRSMAEIAATLIVAWVVEAVWMTIRVERRGDERESWIGNVVGLGLGGFMGMAIALLVAAHREAGHANFLDWFGLWWAIVAIGTLGGMLVMHPVIVERWRPADDREA